MPRIRLERDDIVLLLWALTLIIIGYYAYIRGVEVAMQIEGVYQIACGGSEHLYITPATIMTCESLGCECHLRGVNTWIPNAISTRYP